MKKFIIIFLTVILITGCGSKNKLKCMFNLFRRMWYNLPNKNKNIYNMNKEELIDYFRWKVNMSDNDIRYIVNLKTTEINMLRNKVWPIM